jgi:hypothetical protein
VYVSKQLKWTGTSVYVYNGRWMHDIGWMEKECEK